jgi:hypothetical protein
MTNYKSIRIIDRKPRQVIVDENSNIVNRNPTKERLKGLKEFPEKDGRSKHRPYAKCTEEGLLNELRRFEKKEKRIPTTSDFANNHDYPSIGPYIDLFGSWNKSLEKAFGIKRDKYEYKREKYTDKELLNHLLQFYEENRRPPTEKDFVNNPEYPHYQIYRPIFGSWSKALKLVGLDIESTVKKGILVTNQQKGRFAEMIIRDHFKRYSIDLAGENCLSNCDGICPNGKIYDVKSSGFGKEWKRWQFGTNNKYKDNIEIYYFLAFNIDYTELMYTWRVPGEIVEGNSFKVYIDNTAHGEFTIKNMEEYNITDNTREVLSKYGFFNKTKKTETKMICDINNMADINKKM